MPKGRLYLENFQRGLQTTHSEEGLPLGSFSVFENVRTNKRTARRRAGLREVTGRAGTGQTALTFDPANSNVAAVPLAPVHSLRQRWTVQVICMSNMTAVEGVIGWATETAYPFRIWVDDATGFVNADVMDDANTVTALVTTTTYSGGETLGIQLSRHDTALELWVNGVQEDTATMSSLVCKAPTTAMEIGGGASAASSLDGVMDTVTILSKRMVGQASPYQRIVQPRADYVLAHYGMVKDAFEMIEDRSRYGNNALAQGSPKPVVTTTLAHTDLPVQGMFPYRDRSGEQRLAVLIGGEFYSAEVS